MAVTDGYYERMTVYEADADIDSEDSDSTNEDSIHNTCLPS